MKLTSLKLNDDNPRSIREPAFLKLCDSIREFPKMMELRPIVVNDEMVVLGGNMRLRACLHLKMDDVPDSWVKIARKLSEADQRRFIIEDNISFGEWDFDMLANDDEWNGLPLNDWGLNVPELEPDTTGTHTVEFSDAHNFTIRCSNADQLAQLKDIFDVTGSRIGYEQFKLLMKL